MTSVNVDAGAGQIRAHGRTMIAFTNIESLMATVGQVMGAFRYAGLTETETETDVVGGTGADIIDINATGSGLVQAHGDGDDDTMAGMGLAVLFGDAGNDTLRPFNNLTSLYGGAGNDTVTRQSSFTDAANTLARLEGGFGVHTLTLRLNINPVSVPYDFSAQSVTMADGTQISGIDIVHYEGGNAAETITTSNHVGGVAINWVSAAGGNDTRRASGSATLLDGGFGSDLVIGSTGADSLQGYFDNDTLRGGQGIDTLQGFVGDYVLTGGLGADRFILLSEATNTVPPHDHFTDFSHAQRDKIDVSILDAVASTFGVEDAFRFVGKNRLKGAAGEFGYVWVDKPGAANDQTLITKAVLDDLTQYIGALDGLVTLVKTDFIL